MRIRVSATRVRIADLCLIERGESIEQVPTKPPLAVVEILSPEDRISRYNDRLGDYRRMGIQNVWVIDPANRIGYECSTRMVAGRRIPRCRNASPFSAD
jgi:Uma2 family endonuclease